MDHTPSARWKAINVEKPLDVSQEALKAQLQLDHQQQ